MARTRTSQPVTKATTDLMIGLARMRIGTATDADASTCTTANDVGAVKATGALGEATTKEHQAGFPKQTDMSITEVSELTYEFAAEEVGMPLIYGLLDEIIAQVNTGDITYKQIEFVVQKNDGNITTFFSNHCAVLADISVGWEDDWGGIVFKVDWHWPSGYTHNKAFYCTTTTGASSRSRDNMPITKASTDLAIGLPQIRIGNVSFGTVTTAGDTVPGGWDETNSVGALQSCTLTFGASYKPHYSGYPKKKDTSMLESTTIQVEFQAEEYTTLFPDGIVTGTATKIFDIINDSFVNDASYYASMYVMWELSEGGHLGFWIPNGKFQAKVNIDAKDDWTSFPVTFVAEKKAGTNLIYRDSPA